MQRLGPSCQAPTTDRSYGGAYGRDPEFYAFSRTLEAYRDGQNGNAVVILTTDSGYYRYLEDAAGLGSAR